MMFRLSGASPFYGKTYNEILMKNIKCQVSYDFKEMGNVKVSEDGNITFFFFLIMILMSLVGLLKTSIFVPTFFL